MIETLKVWLVACVAVLVLGAGAAWAQDEQNTDRPGADYSSFDMPGGTAAQCRAACAADAQCKAFTYVRAGVQGPSARCWLKNAVPAAVSNGCCISGVRQDWSENTDRPGADYASFDMQGGGVNACRAACVADAQCKAFTYVRPGFQGPNPRCWLKNAVPAPVENQCCRSGVR